MKNKVIYTSVTNNYDSLPQYDVVDSSFDYICFSNDYPPETKVGHWTIKPIQFEHTNPIHLSRHAKLQPHIVLPNYEWSLWIDSNIIITDSEIYSIINKHLSENNIWYGVNHLKVDCIYDDIKECLIAAKISFKEIKPYLEFLNTKKYPKHNGLFENNVILRKHNSPEVIRIDNLWWNYFLNVIRRDQLSLYYIFSEEKFKPGLLLEQTENTRNTKYFRYMLHNKKPIIRKFQNKITSWFNRINIMMYRQLFQDD